MSKKRIILGICLLGLLGASVGCSAQAKIGTPEVKAATPPPPEPTPPPPPPEPAKPEPAKPAEPVKAQGRVKLEGGKIEITEQVQFDKAGSNIKTESLGLIDEIAKAIKDNDAKIKKVEVGGHTSSEGDAGANMKLSSERANAVMKALIERGIDKGKLTSKGFGVTKPIGDNSTPAGRVQNRRVEFVVTGP